MKTINLSQSIVSFESIKLSINPHFYGNTGLRSQALVNPIPLSRIVTPFSHLI
jgi:hypothetical protein